MVLAVNSQTDYLIFRDFLENACGIILGDNKQYLVSSRLGKLMTDNNIESLGELVSCIKQSSQRLLKEAVVDAMTTNETLWFRDAHPFTVFKDRLLPEFQQSGNGRLKVWSAACSSGQEPYSLSMVVDEYNATNQSAPKINVNFVATDLSPSMLERCKKAEYDGLSLGRGLSDGRLKKFFDPVVEDVWRVKPEVRNRVRFRPLNLMDSFLSLGKFDIVFCRNVLIYFSPELKSDILRRIHETLRPGGYLILGASEGLTGANEYYEMVQCKPGIIYRAL